MREDLSLMSDTSRRRGARRPLGLLLLGDLLLTLALLALFFFFKLLLPALTAPTLAPAPTPTPEPTPAPTLLATPEPTPDPRTPWQIRFAEHFTPVPVQTETRYTSPSTSIEIRTFTKELEGRTAVCHIADIYLARPEQFASYTANNELKYFSVQPVGEMDLAADALLSISGDCYSYQNFALLVRNGVVYKSDHAWEDVCVLWPDGRMETLAHGDYEVEDLLAQGPAQVWCFGPSLLDGEGHVKPSYPSTAAVGYPNPRSAIGYYEPGHYCFVVVDGRQSGYSDGMLLGELAQLFEELGCTAAYNLDGGVTAVMYFNHQPFSRQSNGADRQIGDILVIREAYEP